MCVCRAGVPVVQGEAGSVLVGGGEWSWRVVASSDGAA